jgi:hypothetical protein
VLIGRSDQSTLRLDHAAVSRRHAYLQVLGNRLFAVDLENRTGVQKESCRVGSSRIYKKHPLGNNPPVAWTNHSAPLFSGVCRILHPRDRVGRWRESGGGPVQASAEQDCPGWDGWFYHGPWGERSNCLFCWIPQMFRQIVEEAIAATPTQNIGWVESLDSISG